MSTTVNLPASSAGEASIASVDALGCAVDDGGGVSLGEVVAAWRRRWALLVAAPLLAGGVAFGVTMLIAPVYTATTTFMPPMQAQSSATAALANLGALGNLAGGLAGGSNPADRYVALLTSWNVLDSLIDRFKLMAAYEAEYRIDARRELLGNVQVALGKKDGMISVSVDDTSPKRAAEIANQFVEELRRVSSSLAVTEAQQRRMFFERQLQASQEKLVQAQKSLQSSGFTLGALKSEPRAAAESYARLKAEATATEVRLQTLRTSLADGTPEVQQALSTLAALRAQLAAAERSTSTSGDADYIGNYRNYKYQETLFELYARQFELARVDESREGALFQVIDPATPPEKRTRPKRGTIALGAWAASLVLLALVIAVRASMRRPQAAGHEPQDATTR